MDDLKLSDVLALGSASSFVLTVIYLYGYSRTLRFNLFPYFGLSDYFRLAIEWLPQLLFFGMLGVLWAKFSTRVEHGATKEQPAKGNPNPRFTERFRHGEVVSFAIVMIAAVVSIIFPRYLPPDVRYVTWGFAISFAWLLLFNSYIAVPKLVQKWSKTLFGFIFLFPMFAAIAFFSGMSSGINGGPPWARRSDVEIILKDAVPETGRMLFLLDDYVLLRKGEDTVIAMPKSEIEKIIPASHPPD